jgi:hypothetical protein
MVHVMRTLPERGNTLQVSLGVPASPERCRPPPR